MSGTLPSFMYGMSNFKNKFNLSCFPCATCYNSFEKKPSYSFRLVFLFFNFHYFM
jgi:hypothetical protein